MRNVGTAPPLAEVAGVTRAGGIDPTDVAAAQPRSSTSPALVEAAGVARAEGIESTDAAIARPYDGTTPAFAGIDWAQPWFDALRATAQAALASGHWRDAFSDAAAAVDQRTGRGQPLSFVPQSALPAGDAYEAFIGQTGGVPTRDNLHDFFNALIWLAYPHSKAALNARQAAVIAQAGVQGTRGATRDAATLFDENALLFVTSAASLADALRGFDWHTLFVARRDAWWRQCDVQPFGHALLEKLVTPYKSITAHAWIVAAPSAYFDWTGAERRAWLDRQMAPVLASAPLVPRDFAPLPVLGVPGWWPANAAPAYYQDTTVFRPGRRDRGVA